MNKWYLINEIEYNDLYVLLSPYLYFISFIYLGLYVLGDDLLISQGSFMRTNIYVS